MRRRLDAELVRRGLVDSRTTAQRLVEAGRVLVAGSVATKPARLVDAGEPVAVAGPPPRFVGRGGEKLDAALVAWDLRPIGMRVLDAGASTGGFTDCLLQHGAASVTALDVGHGQLHERLRNDPRVVVVERTNLRHVDPSAAAPYDAVVADLSFISLRTVMAVLVGSTVVGGWLVLLVKPQFEAGRAEVSRGRGVLTDPAVWRRTVEAVLDEARLAGSSTMGVMVSPLHGADGNTEFLVHLVREPPAERPDAAARGVEVGGMPADVEALVEAAVDVAVARRSDPG